MVRAFPFVSDAVLRAIIERDYAELKLLRQVKAWKSATVMAGSILEAILNDRLLSDSARKTAALLSIKKPKGSIDEWKLFKLIEVAEDIGALPAGSSKTVDYVVRDFQNYVHPNKEVRSSVPVGENQAGLAWHALEVVCDYCEKNP